VATWTLWSGGEDPPAGLEATGPLPAPLRGDRTPSTAQEPGRSKPASATPALPTAVADPIPRILPPDAAIEDLRDSLALPPGDRKQPLQRAYRALGHLAQSKAAALRELRSHLAGLDDPTLRGVVLAALGAERNPLNLRWLAGRLGTAPSSQERLGALIALARGPQQEHARAPSLGGLGYAFGPLPANADVRAACASFMTRGEQERAQEALPILRATIERSLTYAALLVSNRPPDSGQSGPCAFFVALKEEQRTQLARLALRHAALPTQARAVLQAALGR